MQHDTRQDRQDGNAPRVRVYVRPQCHLCEAALAVVAEVTEGLGERFEVIDIDTDPALRARWTDQVPVTCVDGQQHDFWRVDATRLRAALTGGGRP